MTAKSQAWVLTGANMSIPPPSCTKRSPEPTALVTPDARWKRQRMDSPMQRIAAAASPDGSPMRTEKSWWKKSRHQRQTQLGDCVICSKPCSPQETPASAMPTNALHRYFGGMMSRGRSEPATATQFASCSFCEQPTCVDCERSCHVCQQRFCSLCTTTDYQQRQHESVCWECHDQTDDDGMQIG